MESTKPALVILAAGLGSRFGGAKQIAPFGMQGHFLFEYACLDAMRAGFEKVLVITKKELVTIIDEQLQKWIHPSRFQIVIQEQTRDKPWGTAHALHFIKDHWKGPFLILNADDYYGSTICQRTIDLLNNGIDSAALVYELGPTLSANGSVARGICTIADGEISQIEEVLQIERIAGLITDEFQRTYASNTPVSMNAWLLNASFLLLLEEKVNQFLEVHAQDPKAEIYLPRVINELILAKELKVAIATMPSEWFGITYAADLPHAQSQISYLEQQIYPTVFPLWT
jgi:dTDP-glucose pyrophosphorylase